MFNINKIINRIRDNDKATPPNSPHKQGMPEADVDVNGAEETTTEGFLCPSCMERFTSPEDLQSHYESYHSDGNLHVCPMCKTKFPTTDQLQIHYASDHAPSISSNSDVRTLRQEVAELQTTLREERWYSEELKREVSRLTDSVNRGEEPEENALMKHQLKALEESRSLLSSEVVLLRNQLAEALDSNVSMKQQKENMEQRVAAMAGERADHLAVIDEERSIKTMLEKKVREIQELKSSLETQLQQRPGSDDVLELRQELSKVQSSMEELSQERDSLEEENRQLKHHTGALSKSLAEAPTAEDVAVLRSQLEEKERIREELQGNFERRGAEAKALSNRIQELEDALVTEQKNVQRQLEANSLVSEEHNTLKEQLATLHSDLEDSRELSDRLQVEMDEAKRTLSNQEADCEAERALISDKLRSSSSEVAQRDHHINELKQRIEEVLLELQERQSQLTSTKKQLSTLQNHFQDQSNDVDNTKSQLRELQVELENERRSNANNTEKLKDLESEITKGRETIEKLESERVELYSKIEAGDGANEAINQLRQKEASILEKLSESQQIVKQQAVDVADANDKLHQHLQECKSRSQADRDRISKLESVAQSCAAELAMVEERCRELEAGLKSKAEALISAEAAWNGLRLDLEHQLQSFKVESVSRAADLDGARERLKKASEELSASRDASKALELKLQKEKQIVGQREDSIRSLDAQLDDQKSKLEKECTKVEALQSDKESLLKEMSNLENVLASTDNKITNLEARNVSLLTERDRMRKDVGTAVRTMKTSLGDLKNEVNMLNEDHVSKVKTASDELELLKTELEKLCLAMVEAKDTISKHSEAESILNTKISELEVQTSTLTVESNQIRRQLEDKQATLDENARQLTDLKQSESDTRARLKEAESQLQGVSAALKTSKDVCGSQQEEMKVLRHSFAEVREDLDETAQRLADVMKEHSLALSSLESSKEAASKLKEQLKERSELKSSLEDQVTALKEELGGTRDMMQSAMLHKTSLETELFDTQKALSELEEKHSVHEQNALELEKRLISADDAAKLKAAEFHEARELLINQKLEVQNRFAAAEDKYKLEISSQGKLRDEAAKEAAKLQKQISNLSSQLIVVQEARNALEQEVERQKTLFEVQVGTLRENLSTLRSDLVTQQDKAEALDKKVDELSGDKLELEAKLENALDERRALLERCLSSETECEKLRALTVELRRKLDDALSALHELGRENQTLQLETAKLVNRKWANDAEVLNCTACQKAFSVTIRKHHCRNCGNIFCNECSSHNAAIAAQKKPVRVCDGCFNELCSK